MAGSATIVGLVNRIDPPLGVRADAPAGRALHFSDGSTARLDPANPRSAGYGEILEDMRQAGIPVYVEVDPQTRAVIRLLVPLVVTVSDITRAESGQMEVNLEISSARHTLSPGNPGFDRILAALEEARSRKTRVVVTETDNHEIIDVRPDGGPDDLP